MIAMRTTVSSIKSTRLWSYVCDTQKRYVKQRHRCLRQKNGFVPKSLPRRIVHEAQCRLYRKSMYAKNVHIQIIVFDTENAVTAAYWKCTDLARKTK